jgi:hypothetical protein
MDGTETAVQVLLAGFGIALIGVFLLVVVLIFTFLVFLFSRWIAKRFLKFDQREAAIVGIIAAAGFWFNPALPIVVLILAWLWKRYR